MPTPSPPTLQREETKYAPSPMAAAEYFQDNYCLHNTNEIPLFKFIVP